MTPGRWESGSEFHWPGLPAPERADASPLPPGMLVFSGRDALRLLLRHGVAHRGWRRLWLPDYYCQDVVAALAQPGLALASYPDNPGRATPGWPDGQPGDAILVVNYFGLRGAVDAPRREGLTVIEDHSHDPWSPWSTGSTADFCVASLRKSLPLTDGGALWSPRGHQLPAAPALTARRRHVAGAKLAAMILKAMYLHGLPIEKPQYRELAQRAEAAMASPGVSAMSEVAQAVLRSFPVESWSRSRAANHALLGSLIATVDWARILAPAARAGTAFSCVVVVDTAERRERVRQGLIAANVYPAVLWQLEQTVIPAGREALDLSRRMLSIHCDGRYGPQDMHRVAKAFVHAGAA